MKTAITKNNAKIDAKDALKGFQYYCPVCGESLILKQGKNIAPYFSHYNGGKCVVRIKRVKLGDYLFSIDPFRRYVIKRNNLSGCGFHANEFRCERCDRYCENSKFEYLHLVSTPEKNIIGCIDCMYCVAINVVPKSKYNKNKIGYGHDIYCYCGSGENMNSFKRKAGFASKDIIYLFKNGKFIGTNRNAKARNEIIRYN